MVRVGDFAVSGGFHQIPPGLAEFIRCQSTFLQSLADCRLDRSRTRLALLDPHLVLQRGYAWLSDAQGQPLVRAAQVRAGQTLQASLADGQLSLQVLSVSSPAQGAEPSPS